MAAIGAVLGAVSSIVGAVGTVAAAGAQSSALEAQAKDRERQAQEQRAAATRQAIEKEKEQKYTLSALQARSAASGGGATDPTVTRLAAGIAQEGNYQTRGVVYEGEARARTLEAQAAIDRQQARATRIGGYFNAGSSLLGGISAFARYKPRTSYARPTYEQPRYPY